MDYTSITKKELLELSKKRELGLKSSMTKAEIIKALIKDDKAAAKKAAKEPVPVPAPTKRKVWNPMLHRFEFK